MRHIDVENPSEDDLKFLRTRGLTLEQYVAQQRIAQAMSDAVVGTIVRRRPSRPLDTPVQVEEVDEPYERWSSEELKTELRNRKLSVEGKKADWVRRLEQDDEENPA